MGKKVAIVGSGVSGLSCAVLFAERSWDVTIFAAQQSAHTTSAVAAAIWFPYDAEPTARLIDWALVTYRRFGELSRDTSSGVLMIEQHAFVRSGSIEIPNWAMSLGAYRLDPSANFPRQFASGFSLAVPLTDTTVYLPYLERRFAAAGGEIRTDVQLSQLEQIDREFPMIVNCTGIGARQLLGDHDLEPHRGQVVIVPKLAISHAIVCDDPPLTYVIPRLNDCVLGGTNYFSESCDASRTETEGIVAECSRVLGIALPQVVAERVGLRPFRRSGVRLESGRLSDGRAVIHNYGHGGAGFTLSWGCAEEVLELANGLRAT